MTRLHFLFLSLKMIFFSQKFANKKIIIVICRKIFLKYIPYFIFQKMQSPVRIFIEFYQRKLIFKGILNVFQKMRKPVCIFIGFWMCKRIFKGIFNIRDILKKLKKNIENNYIYINVFLKNTDIEKYRCFPNIARHKVFERSDCTYKIVFARFDCKSVWPGFFSLRAPNKYCQIAKNHQSTRIF